MEHWSTFSRILGDRHPQIWPKPVWRSHPVYISAKNPQQRYSSESEKTSQKNLSDAIAAFAFRCISLSVKFCEVDTMIHLQPHLRPTGSSLKKTNACRHSWQKSKPCLNSAWGAKAIYLPIKRSWLPQRIWECIGQRRFRFFKRKRGYALLAIADVYWLCTRTLQN